MPTNQLTAPTLAEYVQTVNEAEAGLARGFQRLQSARTPNEVSSAAEDLSLDLVTHYFTLSSVLPPARLEAVHTRIVHGLDALSNDVEALLGETGQRDDSPGAKATVQVYMRSGSTAEVSHIPDGTYHVFVTSGTDWDGSSRRFTRSCAFQRFDRTADFTTTAMMYTAYSLSTTPVPLGNATVSEVAPEEFPTG